MLAWCDVEEQIDTVLSRCEIMADDDDTTLTFTHTRLLVTPYSACFRFYRDTLGFDVDWGDEEGGYADLRTGDTTLALFDGEAMADAIGSAAGSKSQVRQDQVAIVFEVGSVDETFEWLKGEVTFVTEPHDRPGWGIRVAHFRDPAGTLIEINEPLSAS